MVSLFANKPVIPMCSDFASIIGVNEAIVVQQFHYWICKYKNDPRHIHEGKCWVYNTLNNWYKQFPFWSKNTTQRTLDRLAERKIILKSNFNKYKYDRTVWYTLNYDVIMDIVNSELKDGEEPFILNDPYNKSLVKFNAKTKPPVDVRTWYTKEQLKKDREDVEKEIDENLRVIFPLECN